jgi:hypothetical protein
MFVDFARMALASLRQSSQALSWQRSEESFLSPGAKIFYNGMRK